MVDGLALPGIDAQKQYSSCRTQARPVSIVTRIKFTIMQAEAECLCRSLSGILYYNCRMQGVATVVECMLHSLLR